MQFKWAKHQQLGREKPSYWPLRPVAATLSSKYYRGKRQSESLMRGRRESWVNGPHSAVMSQILMQKFLRQNQTVRHAGLKMQGYLWKWECWNFTTAVVFQLCSVKMKKKKIIDNQYRQFVLHLHIIYEKKIKCFKRQIYTLLNQCYCQLISILYLILFLQLSKLIFLLIYLCICALIDCNKRMKRCILK